MQRPLRIALVTETYPPEVNGVAATIVRVVDGLLALGHAVQLIRPRQQPDALPVRADGLLSEVLMNSMPLPRYAGLRMGLPCKHQLVALWTRQRPDAVHIVTEGPLGWSALRAAEALRLPMVSDYRTHFDAYAAHYGLRWLRRPLMAWLRHFHNRTACTMVPTAALQRRLQAQRIQPVRVVARGVDTALFTPTRRSRALRASWGVGDDTTVALYVGRLAPEKNLGTVLAAADAMRRDEPGMRLVLVGDGPDRERLQREDGAAVFAGVQRGESLATFYASADVFLFASSTETFGNVVPEAMASGLAVVAYDDAAAGQLIRHGENGLLAPVGDVAMFCSLARRLAADLPQSRALGRAARADAAQLEWGSIVEAIEAEYLVAMARCWDQRSLQATLPAPADATPAGGPCAWSVQASPQFHASCAPSAQPDRTGIPQ